MCCLAAAAGGAMTSVASSGDFDGQSTSSLEYVHSVEIAAAAILKISLRAAAIGACWPLPDGFGARPSRSMSGRPMSSRGARPTSSGVRGAAATQMHRPTSGFLDDDIFGQGKKR